jgi:hypothetical protein
VDELSIGRRWNPVIDLARPLPQIRMTSFVHKEIEMANKNKQFDSLQGKQGNDSEGIETLQERGADSGKPSGEAAEGNSENLQQGGSRGNSNQGNYSTRGN